jgi:cytochrome oxidase Cu insertion factor (SCO1/SenC/PrrC family)
MLATEPNPGGSLTGGEEFVHSNKFVLIDPKGQIRGYFTGTDPEEVNRLKDELGRLRLAGKGA